MQRGAFDPTSVVIVQNDFHFDIYCLSVGGPLVRPGTRRQRQILNNYWKPSWMSSSQADIFDLNFALIPYICVICRRMNRCWPCHGHWAYVFIWWVKGGRILFVRVIGKKWKSIPKDIILRHGYHQGHVSFMVTIRIFYNLQGKELFELLLSIL